MDSTDFLLPRPTAVALGIASINDINSMKLPLITWSEMKEQKLLHVYYQEEYCNKIMGWARANGFNVATRLGCPVVKFCKLYISLVKCKMSNISKSCI